MKKLLIFLISCLLLIPALCVSVNAEIVSSGSCGWDVSWKYGDGVLQISGEGKIYHYAREKRPPWFDLKDDIKTVIINEGITEIGNFAFANMNMSSVTLPSTLTSIGICSFVDCIDLKSVYIPDSVTNIEEGAFSSCTGITELRLSPSVESIPDNCFNNLDSLKDLVIPEGVVSIGDSAFGSNPYDSVTFPTSLTSIHTNAFSKIYLTKCQFSSAAESYAEAKGFDIEYTGDISGTLDNGILWNIMNDTLTLSGGGSVVGGYTTFKKLLTRTHHLIVEDGVTALNGDLFRDFVNLESVVFGKDIGLVGNFCFDGCSSLSQVTFTGDKLRRVEDAAFSNCGITEIALPEGTEYIGIGAFSDCKSLTSVTFPYTIETIDDAAFSGCSSITSIKLPQYLTTLGTAAFQYCSSLEEIIFHENINSIGDRAFDSCSSLKTINIPGNIKNIGEYCFYYCETLTTVCIEEGIETVNKCAFVGCTSLANITLPASINFIGKSAFDLCPVTVDCPIDSYAYSYAVNNGLNIKGEYTDVKRTAWYYDSVRYVSLKGYMSGMGDKKFSPNTLLTRAQFVQLLFAMEGLNKEDYSGPTGFTDVAEGKWFSPAVKWAKDTGITSGAGNGVFKLNDNVTREQLARFMMKYAEYKNHDISGNADITVYEDVSSVSDWAYDAIEWAVYEGIFTSTSDSKLTLAPRASSTRAVAARVVAVFDTIINN